MLACVMTALPETPPLPRMTVAEFLIWNEQRPDGRYELYYGEPVKMQAERARHANVKGNAYMALRSAVRAAKLPCQVFPDGMTVVINDETCYEPDAILQCGKPVDPDSVTVDEPMIVVEVGSPSTRVFDLSQKLGDYFTMASIIHVLLIDPKKKRAILHTRKSDFEWVTRLLAENETAVLDPPGVAFGLSECFAGE